MLAIQVAALALAMAVVCCGGHGAVGPGSVVQGGGRGTRRRAASGGGSQRQEAAAELGIQRGCSREIK
jgi:hypothetical protein